MLNLNQVSNRFNQALIAEQLKHYAKRDPIGNKLPEVKVVYDLVREGRTTFRDQESIKGWNEHYSEIQHFNCTLLSMMRKLKDSHWITSVQFNVDVLNDATLLPKIQAFMGTVGLSVLLRNTSTGSHLYGHEQDIEDLYDANWNSNVLIGEGHFSTVGMLGNTGLVIKLWLSAEDSEGYRYIRNCGINRKEYWMPVVHACGKVRRKVGNQTEVLAWAVMDCLPNEANMDEEWHEIRSAFLENYHSFYHARCDIHSENIRSDSDGNKFLTDPLSYNNGRAKPLEW